MSRGSAVERAYELARTGRYRCVLEIIRHLEPADRPDVEAHLAEPGARRELILVCSEAWLASQ